MGSEVLEMSVGRGSKRVGERWVRSLAGLSSASLVLWSEWELTREDAAGLLVQPGFRRGGGGNTEVWGFGGVVVWFGPIAWVWVGGEEGVGETPRACCCCVRDRVWLWVLGGTGRLSGVDAELSWLASSLPGEGGLGLLLLFSL